MNIYNACLIVASFFVGLGPGGLQRVSKGNVVNALSVICLPGSNHGGNWPTQKPPEVFEVGGAYDKENLATFRGGSAGDAIFSIYVFLTTSHADVLSRN